MENGLLTTEVGTFIAGISIVQVNQVLSTICFAISAILGIVNIIIKVKRALSDGKLSDEELKEIEKAIEDLRENKNEHDD